MTEIRLLRENLVKFDYNKSYSIIFLNKTNYKKYITELIYVSELMKKDFDWVGIPNEKVLHSRFNHNSYCLLSFYNGNIVGWVWGNNNLTPFWEKSKQELTDKEIYVGGAFLSKKVERPKESGQVFYSMWFDYFLTHFDKETAYSYIDDWNNHSLNLAYNIGMKEYNFIK